MSEILAEQAEEIANECLGYDCIWVSYDKEKEIFNGMEGTLNGFAFQLKSSNFKTIKDLTEKILSSMKAYCNIHELECAEK